MDPQASPPKRMTRARAAAKATESSVKTTKIVTAAAKAKTTRATSATISSKRKTRAEDLDDEEDEDELREPEPEQPLKSAMKPAPKATRGRPKKVVDPEPEAAPVRATRGRPPKKAVSEPAKEEPVRATRTRAKKVQTDEEADEINAEPAKKTTRGRAATVTKPAVKKSVKFEEPDKENVVPPSATTKGKTATAKAADSAAGLRGRPVRKAAVPVTRATRTTKASATEQKDNKAPTPLSPKKVTQMPISRDEESEDELGATPRPKNKSLMKNPLKASLGAPKLAPQPTSTQPEEDEATTINVLGGAPSIILGSPARRPPPSPYKDAMKSPARRVDSIPSLGLSTNKNANSTTQSPHKAPLLQSPAKRPATSPMKSSFGASSSGAQDQSRSPMKLSLLQASAKRPASPVKNAIAYKAPTPTMLSTPLPAAASSMEGMEAEESMDEIDMALNEMEAEMMPDSPTRLRFPGRLSAVLPRHADPVLNEAMLTVHESAEADDEVEGEVAESIVEIEEIVEDLGDPMEVDEPEMEETASRSTTPPQSPPKHKLGMFDLRQKDLAPYDEVSESEDELASSGLRSRSSSAILGTPCPASSKSSRSRTSNVFAKKLRTSNFGFTPLAKQLSEWTGASPLKSGSQDQTPARVTAEGENIATEQSPMKNTFFEDEMSVRPEPADEGSVSPDVEEPVFDDVPVIEEDMALAAEANEMSLMEPDQVEDLLNLDTPEDSMSEASQEYGDENEIPIDPALQNGSDPMVPPVTPKRMVMREFHTVSKVPLKAADHSTPRPVLKKRSHSISRLPVQRPTQGLTRSATVISYSPMKKRRESTVFDTADEEEEEPRAGSAPPVTPTKSEIGWSTAGTPARTPRRDVNPALLSGAVVFVDVHTSEGADASGIFIELLTQMGARCVKSWPWNPSSPPSKESAASGSHRVGITHVVFKDGGKRTLEKVRESDGVVQCVGVSWVLDCERENEWLDEAPYYIDTSMVPRGGHRRRKSMEPRAFANLNGMLVPTPVKNGGSGAARQSQSLPATPVNRRDSALWMHTPEDEHNEDPEQDGIHEDDWEVADMLTPVPVTPAPEAIARFALDVTPETPSTDMDDEDPLAAREVLMTRTCPPKSSSSLQLGEGILRKEKDQGVMMRLMAARRKSLQFAPKIGSPLARTWN